MKLKNVCESIPDGAEVTLHMRDGRRFTGYECTPQDYIESGLVVLRDWIYDDQAKVRWMINAADVVAVEIRTE